MASPLSIALRKTAALDLIVSRLGLDTTIQERDPALREVILLERIAIALPAPAQIARDEAEDKPRAKKPKKANDVD